jgi:methylthioribose-1-phosphate isomerase
VSQINPHYPTNIMPTLQAIKYHKDSKTLTILDQLVLPHETRYVTINSSDDAFWAIKNMVVRGAPAIAIVAALGLAVEVASKETRPNFGNSVNEVSLNILTRLDHLVSARPTAVNLSQAANALKGIVLSTKAQSPEELIAEVVGYAENMLEHDITDNKNIGEHGSEWIRKELGLKDGEKISVLTICNTGSLATAGYGTALGIIRSLHSQGVLNHAYCLETRPYNQGSRLTAYELVYEQIPATLVTDSMAGALLRATPDIKLVVVGADRVAANGDTANKIGTYQLSTLSRVHGVKFMVAAPTTSIDINTKSGDDIVIEERPHNELTTTKGPLIYRDGRVDPENIITIATAAKGINVWNPAFDVTPKENIDAVATEKGVLTKTNSGSYDFSILF